MANQLQPINKERDKGLLSFDEEESNLRNAMLFYKRGYLNAKNRCKALSEVIQYHRDKNKAGKYLIVTVCTFVIGLGVLLHVFRL